MSVSHRNTIWTQVACTQDTSGLLAPCLSPGQGPWLLGLIWSPTESHGHSPNSHNIHSEPLPCPAFKVAESIGSSTSLFPYILYHVVRNNLPIFSSWFLAPVLCISVLSSCSFRIDKYMSLVFGVAQWILPTHGSGKEGVMVAFYGFMDRIRSATTSKVVSCCII